MQSKYILASILIFFAGFTSMAQGTGTPPPPPPSGPTPPGLPIDGGVIALFVVALVYGIYKTYKFSAKRTS